ncbi:IPExxxVDY family protein [Aegicerativicinus sediminis]|uniref:IPExxxVDY family protein n=1 Tax=Aegicerativicinus sediminis TaxID=2893202 RepID=UPI001E3A4C6D|nr:IPExxxVDY family protein [Aegicerativicinus sediminis]
MALHKIDFDEFLDDSFGLIAIHCSLEDYRLAYLINMELDLRLKRQDLDLDYKYNAASYSIYEWVCNKEYTTWNLISNVCKREGDMLYSTGSLFENPQQTTKTFHLIPDMPKVDYFLKITSDLYHKRERLYISQLQNIPQIIACYQVDIEKIKNIDHLIF